MRIKSIPRGFFLFFLFLFLLPSAASAALLSTVKPTEVLVLHSYSIDYQWTQSEQHGLDRIFQPLSDRYRLRLEYMDSNHNPDLLQGNTLREFYRTKFANSHFSLIIAADNAAFQFILQNGNELFPQVPVVFCGVNGFRPDSLSDRQEITGVAEDNDFQGVIDVIARLHPGDHRLVVYGNAGDLSHEANKMQFLRLPPHPSGLHWEFRELPDLESCIEDAATLPPDSLLMMIGGMRNAAGEGIHLQRVNEILANAVKLPIYTAWDFALGHGALGGLVMSGEDQGRLAGEMALRILAGERPEQIPVLRNVANVYMFDYQQLSRYGLKTSQLPAGSILLNVPDNTYRIHQETFWIGLLTLSLLTLAVLFLSLCIKRQKKAEAALAASEEKYSKAFRHCADVVGIVCFSDGRYLEVSDAFFRTFGYTQEEILGKSSAACSSSSFDVATFPLWLDIEERRRVFDSFHSTNCIQNVETVWCTKSGEQRTGLFSAENIDIGAESCLVYAWHDITPRKRAEDALRQTLEHLEEKVEERTEELTALNEELTAINEELHSTNCELQREITARERIEAALSSANQDLTHAINELKAMQSRLVQSEKMAALGGLVAGVAHEINTPMGVSVTAASHLQRTTHEFFTECQRLMPSLLAQFPQLYEIDESAQIISKNLERAAALIHSFKQISVDQSNENRRIFKVKKYLEEILLSLQPQLRKTSHKIKITCDETLEIPGYPGAFAQVTTNLIMNSLTHAYNPSDVGEIHISIQRENDDLLMSYADNGKGMEPQILRRIFDPFFTTRRGTGGSGLGLSIVYNIVTQQFGGAIDCSSQPGQGTIFRLQIPLRTIPKKTPAAG